MSNLTKVSIKNLWTHDPEHHKLVVDPQNYLVLAGVSIEEDVITVGFEEDPSEQFSKTFYFYNKNYEEVLDLVRKALPVLEVAKRVDNALIKLYDEVYSVEYCGGFTCVADLLLMDIDDYYNDAKKGGHSISDYTTYMTYSYLENAWDHYSDLGVFLEDRKKVDAFLESQYRLHKEI